MSVDEIVDVDAMREDWETREAPQQVEVIDAPTVTSQQQQAIEIHDKQVRAIDAVAARAIESAGTPGRDEFVALCMQAKILSMSSAVPKGLRGNAPLCLHVAMIARDLGISPATGVNLIDYIPDDKNNPQAGGQLSLSPELINGQLLRLNLGRILPLVSDADHCIAVAVEPGGGIERDVAGNVIAIRGEIDRYEFTWDMAMRAKLVDSRCTSGATHWVKPGTSGYKYEDKCRCRSGYLNYPERMHWWRASGYLAHNTFPQAMLGMYTAEELGAFVDEDGHAIDPNTVALPEGYNELPSGPSRVPGSAPPDPPADTEAIDKILIEAHALDREGKIQLVDNWNKRDLPLTDAGKIDPLRLTARQVRVVNALLRSCEAAARQRGYDVEAAQEAQRAKVAAQGAETPPEPAAVPVAAVVTDQEPPVEDEAPPDAQETDEKAPQARRAPAMPTGIPEEVLDGMRAEIADLSTHQVTDELTSRGYSPNGTPSERAERLLKVWASEAEGEGEPESADPVFDAARAEPGQEEPGNIAAGRVAVMTTGAIRLAMAARNLPLNGKEPEIRARLTEAIHGEILAGEG